MPTLNCYVSEPALATLRRVAEETGRTVDDLAECAIEEAALHARVEDSQRSEGSRS